MLPNIDKLNSPKLRIEQYIGMKVKRTRVEQGLKIIDVARIAGLSQGMVSKIENAQVSTSLDTLGRLCDALGLTLATLFSDYDRPEGGAQLTRAGEGMEVVRQGTDKGHRYELLSYHRGKRKSYEPFLVTMDDASEVFPTFSHSGQEFLYILEGRIVYRHGNHLYEMGPGDSLSFEAEIPHGPEELIEVPIKMISVINYDESLD
ncbi:MAG: cupin domain-containing protein [Oceanospirillales bacterium]|jgi:transcriptional regulator with XRE-family HTH domain|nr:MAG: cupin domain-containing protein [Oceanospirillales bacterium]